MDFQKHFKTFKKWLRNPIFASLLIGSISALVLFSFHGYGVSNFLIITILACLFSDVLSHVFVRGERGILQIPLLGTQAQPKGYGLIALFSSILITTALINVITESIVTSISLLFSDPIVCLAIGLALSVLVFLDMNARFYEH